MKISEVIFAIQQEVQMVSADGEGKKPNGASFTFTSLRHLQSVLLPLFKKHKVFYTSFWEGDLYTVLLQGGEDSIKSSIRVDTNQPHYIITSITSTYTKNMLMKLLGLVSESEEVSEDHATNLVSISPADLAKVLSQCKKLGVDAESAIDQLQKQGYILSEGNKQFLRDGL